MNLAATATITPNPPARQPGNQNDVVMDGYIHLAPRTHDISLIGEHIPNISCLAADLDRAVQAGWPRRHDIRYSKVEVLLLRWAEDDLGVLAELKDLHHVFTDLFHFEVETYDIPSHKPNNALSRRVLDFLENDKEETLFILYYAGHGKANPQSNEGAVWFANRQAGSPSLPSKVIQSKFEEVDSDVVLLYDCCNAAATTALSSYRGHKGVTEVIAACGYESIAPEVGKHSFSNALTETLAAASKEPPISVAELHARVLNRLKCWTPSFVKNQDGRFSQDEAGRLKHEIQPRRTPIYGILCETNPRRSIALGPLKKSAPLSNGFEQSSSSTSFASSSSEARLSAMPSEAGPNARKRKRCIGEEPEFPQILLAIRLDKHELDISAWKECLLRQLPSEAKDIKIEGIYGSFSTLLLLRVPVIVWNLLPQNPAYTFVGFITSENMAITKPQFIQVADSIKSEAPSSLYPPGGSPQHKQMRQSPSLSRPTKSGSDASKAVVRPDNYSTHVVQDKIPSGVDEPLKAIANTSSLVKSQKITELSTVRSAIDPPNENSLTQLLPLARGTWYSGGSPKRTFNYKDDDELSANHVKIDYPLPRGEPQSHQSSLYRSYSQEIGLKTGKRPRASRPKIKSGCITCKVRRVKCDETKPQCLRCQRFGRICDGYSDHLSKAGDSIISIQPRIPHRIPSATLYNPNVSIHATEDECRYFDIFCDKVAGKMAGFFDSTFWTRIVVQESHRVPAIRYAAISIAALFKSMETAPGPGLKVNVVQNFDKKHHEYAMIQYLKAIQALKQYISASDSPQLRPALIACLLFVCFEEIQGSYASAVQQIYGAIKILRSYYIGQAGSRPKLPKRVLTKAPEIQKSSCITPALRDQMARDIMLREGWVMSLIEDYLGDENSLQTTVDPSSAEDSEQHRSPDKPNESHQTANEQSVHRGRDSSPLGSDFNALSWHSPEPSEIFSRVETNFATPSTVSEILTPIFNKSPSVFSPLFTPQTRAEPARGNPHLVTSDSTPRHLHNESMIEETIIETIVRLDCYSQGLFFGIVPAIPPLIWDIHKLYHLPLPAAFSNFEAAHRCWDFLMDRALQFYRRTLFNRAYCPQIADSREYILMQYRSYMSQLAAFKHAFEPILIAALTPEGIVADPAALVVSLYYHCTLIMLSVVTSDSEMVYDAFLSEFRYIVDTCARLVSHSKITTGIPRFTFDVGIVLPLHLTAIKCRDPLVRQEAIDLLFASPRQEGMWDSVLSARIARWVASCEEEGLQSSQTSRRDEVVERSLGRYERKVPKTMSGAIEKWLEQLSEHADNVDLVDIVGMEDDGVAAEDLDSSVGTPKMETVEEMALNVPEENRVRLMTVEFHIPERYVKVKCQKALVGPELKEERETVIAW